MSPIEHEVAAILAEALARSYRRDLERLAYPGGDSTERGATSCQCKGTTPGDLAA